MKIPKNWWKGYFNDIYLLTDARSVCNDDLTRLEVDLLLKILKPAKNEKILDFCGGYGRHSFELARRGYRDLTVLDASDYLVNFGKKMAKKAGLKINFTCRDARYSRLKNNNFDSVIVMANSFGYFPDDKENFRILKEAHRLLQNGGRLLLDLVEPDHVRNNLKPASLHSANNDVIVLRQREVKKDLIKAREVVISKKRGLLRDGIYCEKMYDKNKITHLLKKAGFKKLTVKKKLSLHEKKSDYGLMTTRMFVTAKKAP